MILYLCQQKKRQMAYEQLQLQNQLCFRLYAASRLITQAYEPYLMPLGITYTQYLVLMVLWEHDEQPVNDIGKKLLLGINTISPLIKRMEKYGLLSRRNSPDDKRKQIVFLTDKGKELREKCASIPQCMLGDIDDCGIKPECMMAIVPVLDNIIKGLNRKVATNLKERRSK